MGFDEDKVKVVKVIDIADPLFEKANQLFVESFIEDERRDLNQIILNNIKFNLFAALYNDDFVASITIWEFSIFIFVEHEAIKEKDNNRIWGLIFKKFFNVFPNKMIIIEVDRPTDKISTDRIEFYKSIGYHLNSYDYIQPRYSQAKSPVPMYLMSYPVEISPEKYPQIRNYIYEQVYNKISPQQQTTD